MKPIDLSKLDFTGLQACIRSGLFTCEICGKGVLPGATLCLSCKAVAVR